MKKDALIYGKISDEKDGFKVNPKEVTENERIDVIFSDMENNAEITYKLTNSSFKKLLNK